MRRLSGISLSSSACVESHILESPTGKPGIETGLEPEAIMQSSNSSITGYSLPDFTDMCLLSTKVPKPCNI